MKKYMLLIPILGLVLSCSGGNDSANEAESTEMTTEQIEAIEHSTQELDAVMDSTSSAIDTLQNDVDKLLEDI